MTSPPPTTSDTVLFRPIKKRKIYRQRHDDSTNPSPQLSSPNPPFSPASASAPAQPNLQSIDELIASSTSLPTAADEELEPTQVSISEILRLRQKNKNKRSGVEFRASGHIARDQDGELVIRHAATATGGEGEPVPAEVGGGGSVIRKFAPQTGTVGDVNKHM
jgi:hypothetical protein